MVSTTSVDVTIVMGKAEGRNKEWHGHVSALTISPVHRKLGLANLLMKDFERASDSLKGWFVDLFVRPSNKVAVAFYKKMGYTVYRKVRGYYFDPAEDAFDLRKPGAADTERKTVCTAVMSNV